jgi:hypothetical protein
MRAIGSRIFASTRFAAVMTVVFFAEVANAQTLNPQLRPDLERVLAARMETSGKARRQKGYAPARAARLLPRRDAAIASGRSARRPPFDALRLAATNAIQPGTQLSRVLHTSQINLTSSAGTNEQFVDRNSDLSADERTTFDSDGGSFDIAVGRSGTRYEVYSATLNNTLVGALVVALDTNGDYVVDSSSTFDLQRDFDLPSAAAVVSGVSKSGREFVIVSSSGYYNSADPDDPNNEPSPGVVLLVRDGSNGGFDNSLSRELVTVGDNSLYNANGLALLPNNDLLIADFHSDELRVIRDTNNDGIPDTLDTEPYYSYQFSDDKPLDVAVNSRGVVFSHSAGDNTLLLVIYDLNEDGRGDFDEVAVEGLSIDDNLFLHGLTTDRLGNVYIIEDASGAFDEANGGVPRVDAFPDGSLNGFLSDGVVFVEADSGTDLALTGLALGAVDANQINDATIFVRQQYLDFLNREPDGGGWSYWTNEITTCGNSKRCASARRTAVSAAFFVEQEFQNTGSFVYRLYKEGLGRRPGYDEFSQDRAQIDITNLENTKRAFSLAFVQRNAFAQKYAGANNASSFVDSLLATILQSSNVNLASQRDALITRYNDGVNLNESRALALREAAENAAVISAEYNASFVLMQYFGYLRRDADQGGFDFWLNVLNNREPNNYRAMVCAFITSREYQERFGLELTRSNADCKE